MKKTFNRAKQFSSKKSDRPRQSRGDSPGQKRFDREIESMDRPKKSFNRERSQSRPRFEQRDIPASTPKKTPGGFELYETVCAKCGRKCDIPFKPTSSKPVYCRSCFRDGAAENSSPQPFNPRERQKFTPPASAPTQDIEEIRKELRELNRKLDKIMKGFKLD